MKAKRPTTITLTLIIFTILAFLLNKITPLLDQIITPYHIQLYQGHFWGLLLNLFSNQSSELMMINLFTFTYLSTNFEKQHGGFKTIILYTFIQITSSSLNFNFLETSPNGLLALNTYLITHQILSHKKRYSSKLFYLTLFIIPLSFLITKDNFVCILTSILNTIIINHLSLKKERKKVVQYTLLAISACVSTYLYSPWSAEWNFSKGYFNDLNNNQAKAKTFYREALKINPNHLEAQSNLKAIIIGELSDKAFIAHTNNRPYKALFLYKKILKIDPKNFWAKENISHLKIKHNR